VWLDRQILKGNMNIIAYSMPWEAFSNDSTFVQDIVKMRDSIGKKYVPGPEANNRKLILEGFIFAPSANKRDDLLELEAILKTLEIPNS